MYVQRRIHIGSPTYVHHQLFPERDCEPWKDYPLVNPDTRRRAKLFRPFFFKQKRPACAGPGASNIVAVADKSATGIIKRSRDDGGFLERRKRDADVIKRIIDAIPSKQWDRCMTGARSSVFLSRLENVRLLGSGTFGQVYAATVRGKTFVVKEAYLDDNEQKLMLNGIMGNKIGKNAYPEEFRILEMVQSLLKSNKSPNFSYVYNLSACDGCIIGQKPSGSCYLTFMELADGDGKAIPPTRRDDQVSIFAQLMMAVSAVHTMGIFHRDIKKQNILFKRVPAGGWYEYKVDDKVFYVQNTGYLALLSDFGVSTVLTPKYSNGKFYGTRNVRVVKDKLVPITIAGNPQIRWYGAGRDFFGTFNRMYKSTKTSIDLDDVKQYPPQEYFNDIQDVVRMFIGGKQTVQPGHHSKWLGIDAEFERILINRCYSSEYQYNVHSLHMLVAADMLRRVLPSRAKPKGSTIWTFKQ